MGQLDHRLVSGSRYCHGFYHFLSCRDLLETKGSRERQEIRVIQVNRDPLVCQEKLECKALKDHLEWVVMTDYR